MSRLAPQVLPGYCITLIHSGHNRPMRGLKVVESIRVVRLRIVRGLLNSQVVFNHTIGLCLAWTEPFYKDAKVTRQRA